MARNSCMPSYLSGQGDGFLCNLRFWQVYKLERISWGPDTTNLKHISLIANNNQPLFLRFPIDHYCETCPVLWFPVYDQSQLLCFLILFIPHSTNWQLFKLVYFLSFVLLNFISFLYFESQIYCYLHCNSHSDWIIFI